MTSPILIILAVSCLLVKISRLSAERIQSLRLKPLAVIALVAEIITPTNDLVTNIALTIPLFAVYLVVTWMLHATRSNAGKL